MSDTNFSSEKNTDSPDEIKLFVDPSHPDTMTPPTRWRVKARDNEAPSEVKIQTAPTLDETIEKYKDIGKTAAAEFTKGALVDVPTLPRSIVDLVGSGLGAAFKYGVVLPANKLGLTDTTPSSLQEKLNERSKGRRIEREAMDESVADYQVKNPMLAGLINRGYPSIPPDRETTQKVIEKELPFTAYNPKDTPARYAGSIARELPSAFLAPGRGIVSKVSQTGLMGAGAEAGGDLASVLGKEELAPYFRMAGGMLTPVAVEKIYNGLSWGTDASNKKLFEALAKDMRLNQSNMTPQEIQNAFDNGLNPALLDMAGPNTRKLFSQIGGLTESTQKKLGDLNEQIIVRSNGLKTDLSTSVKDSFGVVDDAAETAAKIAAAEKPYVDQLYQIVRNDPASANVWSNRLQGLTEENLMKQVIDKVEKTSLRVRRDAEGNPIPGSEINPLVLGPNGAVTATPNLNFWNDVKIELDGLINQANRSGSSADAGKYINLKKQLTGAVDDLIPSYASARSAASEVFGATDAIEAGYKSFAGIGKGAAFKAEDVLNGFKKLNADEQALFREGQAGYLAELATATGFDNFAKILDNPNFSKIVKNTMGDDFYHQLNGKVISSSLLDKAPFIKSTETTQFYKDPSVILGGVAAGVTGFWDMLKFGVSAGTALQTGLIVGGGFAVRELANLKNSAIANKVLDLALSPQNEKSMQELGELVKTSAQARNALYKLQKLTESAAVNYYLANPPAPSGEPEASGGRIQRASGGRAGMNHVTRAAMLIRAAERAKNQHGDNTESLLNQPDESIAKALKVANSAI